MLEIAKTIDKHYVNLTMVNKPSYNQSTAIYIASPWLKLELDCYHDCKTWISSEEIDLLNQTEKHFYYIIKWKTNYSLRQTINTIKIYSNNENIEKHLKKRLKGFQKNKKKLFNIFNQRLQSEVRKEYRSNIPWFFFSWRPPS